MFHLLLDFNNQKNAQRPNSNQRSVPDNQQIAAQPASDQRRTPLPSNIVNIPNNQI